MAEKCGCTVKTAPGRDPEIIYCELHKHAGVLLVALRDVVASIDGATGKGDAPIAASRSLLRKFRSVLKT